MRAITRRGLLSSRRGAITEVHFEEATSSPAPAGWTARKVGADVSIGSDPVNPYVSTLSAKIASGGGDDGDAVWGELRRAAALQLGVVYRISGAYRTAFPVAPHAVSARILVGPEDDTAYPSGREHGAFGLPAFAETFGEWRRFFFDVRGWSALSDVSIRLDLPNGEVAALWLDDVELRPVFGFQLHESRIARSAIPAVETGGNDVYFGGKRIGAGSVALMHHDAAMERLLGSMEWLNHDVLVDALGEFDDGQAISADDGRRQFSGLIQSFRASDTALTFEVQDARVFFHVKLPPRVYDAAVFPGMDARLAGRVRPLFWGAKENITPSRIAFDATFAKYGIYEIADTTDAPNGIKSIDFVYAYLDANAARDRDAAKRLTLTPVTDYTADLVHGWLTVNADVGPYEVTTENNKINFNIGAGELTATLTVGLYTAAALATHVAAQMSSASGATITVTYSNATNKFTISKASGTLQLLANTGVNKDISAYPLMGYRKGANFTGALTYTSDDPLFASADVDHILRINAKGYKDDSAGRYTGVASALIDVGADICQMVIERHLKKRYATLDQTSFLFARARAPESLAVYINTLTTTKDLFDRLEQSNVANIVVDGSGQIFYRVYVGDVPAGTPELTDHDYLSGTFEIERAVTDVFRSVLVRFDQDPTTNEFEGRQVNDDSVVLRFGRVEQKVFETYIKIGDAATALATRLITLAQRPARQVSLRVKSRLIDREVGDKVRLFRRRAADPDGKLSGQTFRIIRLSKNPQAGEIQADLVDDVVTVAGVACAAACQNLCQGTCQGCAQTVCEGSCQQGCEQGCEVAGQGCGFTTCQETCQQTTQGCGFTSCQTACQLAAQGCGTTCEQTAQGCGSACEVACQGCGQTTCQTNCQRNCQQCSQAGHCQETCESTCQGCGQTVCQEACEQNSQNACDIFCQSFCQDICQQGTEG